MTDNDVLLEKIENLSNKVGAQSADIADIKETISLIAVQSTRIDNLYGDVAELKRIRDECSKEMASIQKFQAGCPKEEHQRIFIWMWGALGLHSTVLLFIIGLMLKSTGGG